MVSEMALKQIGSRKEKREKRAYCPVKGFAVLDPPQFQGGFGVLESDGGFQSHLRVREPGS